MSATIWGMGSALPRFSVEQEEAARSASVLVNHTGEAARHLARIYRLTGIERRHSVILNNNGGGPVPERQTFFPPARDASDKGPGIGARMQEYEREAAPLAGQACRRAIEDANLDPAMITHLVTVSCSGFAAPGVDVHLIKSLGLKPTTQRTHVGFMGCHGALNGLRAARGYVQSEEAIVLIVAVELCSLHYCYQGDIEHDVANALFADGSAAMIVGPSAVREGWLAAATGSCLIPDSEHAMSWRIRDHGFAMTLSQEVPALIKTHLRPWLEGWLAEYGLRAEDIESWAVHPGGPAILRAAGTALGLSRERLQHSWAALRDYGNMSSPTLFFILDELRRQKAPRPCVALGFGPGLVAETALFQ